MPPTSPEQDSARPPHPLAGRLVQALGAGQTRVIDFAAGSGRNARALRSAGLEVLEISDAAAGGPEPLSLAHGRYAAALSTHGLLHGTPATVGGLIAVLAGVLEPRGRLFATFGSTRDARFDRGQEVEAFVYAPLDGDERGVPHVFFDEPRLRALLAPWFEIETLEEAAVDEIAGAWAHREKPLERAVHWLVEARRPAAPE